MGDNATTIAVDGGQSALRLRVLPDGRSGSGPGYTHDADSVAGTVNALRKAAEEAGVRGGPVDVACLGLTGLPADAATLDRLAEEASDVLGAAEVRLCGDMVTAHVGALPDGYGVVLAAGTGAICLAVDPDGGWRRVDGHGYLFGDDGSAFAIGRAGLAAVLRARDARPPMTTLVDAAGAIDPAQLYHSATVVDLTTAGRMGRPPR